MGASQTKSGDALAEEIVRLTKPQMDAYEPRPRLMHRANFGKTVGLVNAQFIVRDDLQQELQVGVFSKPGKAYSCWVRFSNANPKSTSDMKPDIRGCAIQLLSPEDARTPTMQDFVLINRPTVPLGTPELFRDLIKYGQRSKLVLLSHFLVKGSLPKLVRFVTAGSVCESIRGEKFYSTTPFAFGDRIVKYALMPQNYMGPEPYVIKDMNYLTIELQQNLEKCEVRYDFCVQFRTDGNSMSIDDASVEWKESKSPFVKVATLVIPMQDFTQPSRYGTAEALQFNPAHAWPEHRPVGRMNEVRAKVYRALSEYRLQQSGRGSQDEVLMQV